MKKIFKYMIVGLVACTTLSSCLESSLDTNPTDSMSGSGLLANANAALVPLNGLYRSMYSAWSPTDNTHQCFGISAYNLMADVMGEDMIMAAMGSGWFWYDCLYNVKKQNILLLLGAHMIYGIAIILGFPMLIIYLMQRKLWQGQKRKSTISWGRPMQYGLTPISC